MAEHLAAPTRLFVQTPRGAVELTGFAAERWHLTQATILIGCPDVEQAAKQCWHLEEAKRHRAVGRASGRPEFCRPTRVH